MKLKYEAQKGAKINSRFIGFTTYELGWWYNVTLKKWEFETTSSDCGYSSHQPCSSKRAFARKLKKAPKGVEFVLGNRYSRNCIFGIGSLKNQ